MCKYSLYLAKKSICVYIFSQNGEKMKDIAEILDWYILAGVENISADEPCDMLNRKAAETNPVQVSSTPSFRPATTILAQENEAACVNAKDKCRQAGSLDELRKIVDNFEGCSLKFSANSTVFGDGNFNADVMLIGEAPGADEDRMGKPFVGRSGQLLKKMLNAIGLKRQDCYITNILPWRPPGNRTPTDGEIAVCLPFLMRQIEFVKPKIIFLLGASAANAVLGNSDSISSMRGKMLELCLNDGTKIQVIASFHPAYLLRNSTQKSKSWSDLLRLQRYIAKE